MLAVNEIMKTPFEAVAAFIVANHAWNLAANHRYESLHGSDSAGKQAAMDIASQEYRDLVSRFCSRSVAPQGVSCGDDGTHDPERESIQSVSVSGYSAIVRTKHVGLNNFVSEYEYHLVQESDEWKLSSLLYVDDDK